MAVPPISQARTHQLRFVPCAFPFCSTSRVGLLIAVALPLAILAIPNTISVVAALLPPDVSQVATMRAHGLALPAMLLTVPLGAVAARRFHAAPMAVVGLTVLAVADAGGGFAGSAAMVGVLRVLHGIGAGLVVPATLIAATQGPKETRPAAAWAGVFAASLLVAQALALWPLDDVTSWQVTLQPYPLLTGVALGLAAVYLMVWLATPWGRPGRRQSRWRRSEVRLIPRGRPSGGHRSAGHRHDVLTGRRSWSPQWPWSPWSPCWSWALSAPGDGAGGRALAFTNVAVGLVILPTAAQTTSVELGGLGGPGLSGLWWPFALAVVVAPGRRLRRRDGRPSWRAATPTGGGLVAVVAGLCAIRLLVPASSGSGARSAVRPARGGCGGRSGERVAAGGSGCGAVRALALLPGGSRRIFVGHRDPGDEAA